MGASKTVRFAKEAKAYSITDHADESLSSPVSSSSWTLSPDTSASESFDSDDSPAGTEWGSNSTATITPETFHPSMNALTSNTPQQDPSTPSPTWSNTSLSSSPDSNRSGSQRSSLDRGVSLPTPSPLSFAICDELVFREVLQHSIDLTRIPSSSALHPQWQCPAIVDDGLTTEATIPALQRIVLVNRMLPWHINIVASSGGVVTVGDILGGLHRALFTPVTEAEYNQQTADKRLIIDRAFGRRVERRGDPDGHQGGLVRRIDFLEGNSRFVGLSRINSSSSQHVLRFSVRSFS